MVTSGDGADAGREIAVSEKQGDVPLAALTRVSSWQSLPLALFHRRVHFAHQSFGTPDIYRGGCLSTVGVNAQSAPYPDKKQQFPSARGIYRPVLTTATLVLFDLRRYSAVSENSLQ